MDNAIIIHFEKVEMDNASLKVFVSHCITKKGGNRYFVPSNQGFPRIFFHSILRFYDSSPVSNSYYKTLKSAGTSELAPTSSSSSKRYIDDSPHLSPLWFNYDRFGVIQRRWKNVA
ncbi:hypothetical protein CEXT_468911 [Caerostris extrusa]|uniref:Uncharacterized protein n=1 Tax=Caerostris extrusa TaxID=172846 RepID=A0AAV4P5K2_CAEEX|nr:hypothetical protein CEXT_468911 [Caerostris extrusa]